MAAEFEGNEVIFLAVGRDLVRVASRLKLLRLQVVRVRPRRSNGARPALTQIVCWMLAWVTCGFVTLGVVSGSGYR